MMKIWFRIRRAWDINKIVFRETLAMLSDKQANELYDIVKYSLYTNSYAEIVIKHPELKVLLKNDDDRFCMHDIYEYLSWRLGRQEPSPPYSRPAERMRLLRGELPEFFK